MGSLLTVTPLHGVTLKVTVRPIRATEASALDVLQVATRVTRATLQNDEGSARTEPQLDLTTFRSLPLQFLQVVCPRLHHRSAFRQVLREVVDGSHSFFLVCQLALDRI